MDEQKKEWLKKNDYKEILPIYKYAKAYNNTVMLYTEEYVRNSNLEYLDKKNNENIKYFKDLHNEVNTI